MNIMALYINWFKCCKQFEHCNLQKDEQNQSYETHYRKKMNRNQPNIPTIKAGATAFHYRKN